MRLLFFACPVSQPEANLPAILLCGLAPSRFTFDFFAYACEIFLNDGVLIFPD